MLRRLRALIPFARYRVEGESMAPAFAVGERVFVSRAAYWFSKPRPGDLVVVRDPRQPDRLLLKRIDRSAGEDGWLVLGDNPEASTDSRTFGPVPREL
ncbi:MAG: nickel-type superoxide dismutase maturation protease, partial [Chloroflexi bacterium]|nr:nickel-type superoxide dismutase maturation protease [Chloroflexota bacterium]